MSEVVPIALLVPQKQVLAVRGVDAGPVLGGLLDGRHRRVLVPLERNPEVAQPFDDWNFFGRSSTETVRAR